MQKTAIGLPKKEIENVKKRLHRDHTKRMHQILSSQNNLLSIVLKGHLIIEGLIDDILQTYNGGEGNMRDKKFSEKIDILKFCSIISLQTYEKLKTLNKIRNSFAHNLNYKLTHEDIDWLLKGNSGKIPRRKSDKIIQGIICQIGYLDFLKYFNQYYPFLATDLARHKVFQKDLAYKALERDIADLYKSLKLDLDEWEIVQ
jgi:uncharacterized protein YutE (UPF0331/DUF86 family)